VGTKVEIFHILYFFEQGNVEKHDRKDIGEGHRGKLERPKKIAFETIKRI
jgi:hypothetical protein